MLGEPALIWNSVKLALRKTHKEKGHAIINVAGLAAGMACCMTIFLWVQDETSYDRFHDKGGRILRVFTRDFAGGTMRLNEAAPAPIGAALVAEYPGVGQQATEVFGAAGQFLEFSDDGGLHYGYYLWCEASR